MVPFIPHIITNSMFFDIVLQFKDQTKTFMKTIEIINI